MAKFYDYTRVISTVYNHREIIDTVSLAMREDEYWTYETVYENGEFVEGFGEEGYEVAGIASSFWATPIMIIVFKDGSLKYEECWYEGEQ